MTDAAEVARGDFLSADKTSAEIGIDGRDWATNWIMEFQRA